MTPTSLPLRPLGTTDMSITRVGFGAWAIGGNDWAFGWGAQDDTDSIAAIHHALDVGINWIDTAAVYGLGHSEEVVARALKDIPASRRPLVFTKCGLVWDEQDHAAAPRRIGRADSLRREVEASLKRLDVERIDLYQMHWPAEDGTPLEEYWSTLVDLKKQGKIRAVGLSNHNVAQMTLCEKIGHIDTLQPPFSAIRRDNADELAWCRNNRTGVIVYAPMSSGLLSGGFSAERVAALPADDWRSRAPAFTGDALRKNLAVVDAMKPIAARHNVGVGSVAIAWTLKWPGVTGAIVGARNPKQIDGWLSAATLELSDADVAEITAVLEKTGAGTGAKLSPPRQ